MTRTLLGLSLAAVVWTSGCASMSLPFGGPKSDIVHATAANPIMETMTLWEAGEGRGIDNLPTRGFAGQVLFFTYKDPSPAMVTGNVTVYVFDNLGSDEDQSRPLWQHTFTPEQWNALSVQTNLGTAYQLFVPYTRKGQHEAHCSVRIKFEPADGGPPVYSKMTNVKLDGNGKGKAKGSIRHERIEPKRFDTTEATAMTGGEQPKSTQPPLRSSSVALPGRNGLTIQSAARLQQLAQEMVREQQPAVGDIQQAGYAEPVDEDADEDAEEPSAPGNRYRLYR